MGHSSVTTTEVYSNMNLKRVSQDFPTIVAKYVNQAKIGKWDTKKMGYNSIVYDLSYTILRDRNTGLLLWEQEIGSSNLSTPTRE